MLSVNSDTNEKTTISPQTWQEEYSDVFKGIGEFEGEYSIKVDPTVQPVIHAPRTVPHALRSRLKEELDRMEDISVIAKVTRPTDWVNSLVVVEKPKSRKLRLCLHPKL